MNKSKEPSLSNSISPTPLHLISINITGDISGDGNSYNSANIQLGSSQNDNKQEEEADPARSNTQTCNNSEEEVSADFMFASRHNVSIGKNVSIVTNMYIKKIIKINN